MFVEQNFKMLGLTLRPCAAKYLPLGHRHFRRSRDIVLSASLFGSKQAQRACCDGNLVQDLQVSRLYDGLVMLNIYVLVKAGELLT
jgi:hypothetical protein